MAEETIRILCELQTVGDSLTGHATRHDGETHEFTGWLGLLGALQALLADADAGRAAAGEPVRESEPNPDLPSQTRGPT
jgi:hypothetical protein